MTITGETRRGTKFTVEIGEETLKEIGRTPNRNPNGLTVEREMSQHLEIYIQGLELAFAAPEPLRRSFVEILQTNSCDLARKFKAALGLVHAVFKERVIASQ